MTNLINKNDTPNKLLTVNCLPIRIAYVLGFVALCVTGLHACQICWKAYLFMAHIVSYITFCMNSVWRRLDRVSYYLQEYSNARTFVMYFLKVLY